MAIDAWLLQQHCQGNHPPTLRFYRFDPVAISLGYLQHTYPPHWNTVQWQGQSIALIQRPTGGRAVLHCNDLCFSIITSHLKGTRSQIYSQLCEFLIQGWRTLGVDLDYGKAGRGYIHHPSCFATATSADLIDREGNKLIGSAMRFQGQAILQQGSIQLSPDPILFEAVFGEVAPQSQFRDRFEDSAFIDTVISTLTAAANHSLGIELLSQPLSDDELSMITESILNRDQDFTSFGSR
ncbi:MAG: lipoate--protein ligase family protein [Synechococcales bacterium]|nr:lipoate--protein ligase family protein [Synechococcales bacterium]